MDEEIESVDDIPGDKVAFLMDDHHIIALSPILGTSYDPSSVIHLCKVDRFEETMIEMSMM